MELDSDPESIDVLDIYLFGDNYVSAVREVIVGE